MNPVTRFRYHPVGTLASRASLFAVGPAISLVTPLIAIPVIVRMHGPEAWTAVAIGQSVGALGGLLLALSWPQLGPLVIAHADASERPEIVAASTGSRLLMLAALAVPLAVTAAVLSPSARIAAALSAVAATDLKRAAPECRYVVIDSEGRPAAAGVAPLGAERSFQVDLTDRVVPGRYTLSALIAVNGNVMNADLHRIQIVVPAQR